jgi:hypothetical protein
VLWEIDALLSQGVEYVYFVDEVFVPDPALLLGLRERELAFGVQIRLDDWTEETLELLGSAGCVSIRASIEGALYEGRSTWPAVTPVRHTSLEALVGLLAHARAHVPFVQADLVEGDLPDECADLRILLQRHGIWAHEPAPPFPYPGSPDYARRWGAPDDAAWERAHTHYLAHFAAFTDVPGAQPLSLSQLELPDGGR